MRSLLNLNDARRSKMINNTSGGKEYFQAKQEGDNSNDQKNYSSKTAATTSSSRQWAGLKNSRIVRVSRSFGGKDRHSKVCTIKGLRDRRIRLSVPTAIQLYALQDRLGLSQPSKVIDWLLDATKDDIDKLPPLQIPLNGDFNQFHQPNNLVTNYNPQDLNSPHQLSFSPFFTPKQENHERMKGKEVEGEENVVETGGLNFFPIPQSSFPGFIPYNSSYYNWEPSNLSLSQFGSNQGLSISQTENSHTCHNSLSLLPSSLALPPMSQFSLATSPSLFPPYMPTLGETISQHVLPNTLVPGLNLIDSQNKTFVLNVNSSKFHSQNNVEDDSQPNEGKGGSF